MPIENDESTQAILQALDRSVIMILLANLARTTKSPNKIVDNVFESIKESLMERFQEQPADSQNSFIFESLAGNAKQEYEKLVDDLIYEYKRPVIEMLRLSKPTKK